MTPAVDKPSGMYQCGICKRNYNRLDHLSRHTRSHTQNRPHKCHLCPKTFARTDLLKRHISAHERHSARLGLDTAVSSSEDVPPPGRVSLACKACSANHLRCSDDKPCKRCVDKDIECVWNTNAEPEMAFTPPQTEGERTNDEEPSPSSARTVVSVQAESSEHAADRTVVSQPATDIEPAWVESSLMPHEDELMMDPLLSAAPMPFFDGIPSFNIVSAPWCHMEPSVGPLTSVSLDFEDMSSYRFSETYDTIPFATLNGQHRQISERDERLGTATVAGPARLQPLSRSSSDPGQPAAMCTEAFRNSHWHFRPGTKDYAGADDQNLSLPSDSGFDSPESRVVPPSSLPHQVLSVAARDRILTMIIRNANPATLSKAVAYFPSSQLLNNLVHLYLHSPVSRAASFIHVPTFDPNERRAELLAAMAAGGAVLTSNPALIKLGFAIAEVARIAIASLWDSDNSLIRDLQLLQAFCIILELGLWGGHGRQVEIAESFLQPLVTMVRRGGHFRRASYPQPTMEATHPNSDETHNQWLAWIETESFKRFVFRLLQHDTNASMALLVNPIISYTELRLPVPDSATLWSAVTAGQWKLGYAPMANHQALTVGDLIEDPDALIRQGEMIDKDVAAGAMVSLTWMLTWDYTRMTSFQRLQPSRFNLLVTKLRYDELRQLLDSLTIVCASQTTSDPALTMRLELINLHIHMSFEDVQLFAGMQGAEQARAVYPSLSEWSLSESARKAVYHAAQVVRAARNLPQGFIQGPEAIMMYYASLALWVYGLLVGKHSGVGVGEEVHLDRAEENVFLRRFLQTGQGRPCIQSGAGGQGQTGSSVETTVGTSKPDAILETVISVFEENFRDTEMAPLPQKLIQLMQELSRAAKRSRHSGTS